MTDVLRFAVVGLASGAIITLISVGIVQIYRGSGVLNFAQGALALASAMVAYRVREAGAPWPLVLLAAAIVGAVLGAGVQLLVMWPLRKSSQLVRIIATIGVLTIVQSAVQLVFDKELSSAKIVGPFFSTKKWEPIDGVNITYDRLILCGIAVGLAMALAIVSRRSRFGLATEAAAENAMASRALGYSPAVLGLVNWAIGGTLAGLAGALLLPIAGLVTIPYVLLVVPGLAAAMLGGFRWYGVTAAASFGLAISQSLLTQYGSEWGWPGGLPSALPFIVIVVVLTMRGSAIPRRDEIRARLPRVARTRPTLWKAAVSLGVAVAVSWAASDRLANVIITTATFAVVALSLVVVTGLTGQISLGQFALAGFGALVAARLDFSQGWPFVIAAPIGIVAAAALGALFALPSLKARGPALAVATIGMALAIERLVLNDVRYTAGLTGTPVRPPSLFGWKIDATAHPQRYAVVSVVAFAVIAVLVANVRSSGVGRRLLAVRSNERAATSLGIRVASAKVTGFVLGAAIAASGGVLMGFRFATVQYSQFGFFASLQAVTTSLVGGIGYILGALIAALQVPSGVLSYVVEHLGNAEQWVVLISGIALITTLITYPDGVARAVLRSSGRTVSPAIPTRDRPAEVRPATATASLAVRGLTVRYGGVTAVDGLDFDVVPGTITALIGANGAGKTSAIDAISGFTRSTGTISIGDVGLHGLRAHERSRCGIARAFQTVELFDDLTVAENLLVGAEQPSRSRWLHALSGRAGSILPPHVADLARTLDLDRLLDQLPEHLSHGERRLVGVARALAQRPAVLLLDEPAAGLDPTETRELGVTLRRVVQRTGVGVLLVEHDLSLVTDISDLVVAMDFGRRIFIGAPDEVRGDIHIRRAYLGVPDDAPLVEVGL